MNYNDFIENLTKDFIEKAFEEPGLSKKTQILPKIQSIPNLSVTEVVVCNHCIFDTKDITNPTRSIKCFHIECVEASCMIASILLNGECPLCQAKCDLTHIYIDLFLFHIYKIMKSKNVPFVIIDKGTLKWRLFDPYYTTDENLVCNQKNGIYNIVYQNRDLIKKNNKITNKFNFFEE